MADKHEMLSRIKAALGSPPHFAAAKPAQAARAETESADRRKELVAQFSAELEAVGGRLVQVTTGDEARSYILDLVTGMNTSIVAASDPDMVNWLMEQGVETVPPLQAFAARSTARPNSELMEEYKQALIKADIGVTGAEYAIADTGTLVLISGGEQHRLISLVPPVHICLLNADRILPDLSALITRVRFERYSSDSPPQAMTFITGSSRTADIELTLTRGVHGPREVHVVLTIDSSPGIHSRVNHVTPLPKSRRDG
jgi:L-lactate utilization protein LutC